jgi:hypothetical protein
MTGAANAVSEQLARIDLPPRVSRFLHCLERVTFGWAGAHQQEGREHPGAWCPFRLSDWVERTGMTRSQILLIRQRLVEDGFIWYEADADRRGGGRIGWNLDVASWKPFAQEHPRWGGARPGAGRPRKPVTEAGVINVKNTRKDALQAETGARAVPGGNSSLHLKEPAIINLKNPRDEAIQAKVPARSTPNQKSRWQLEERASINLKKSPEAARRENAPACSTPGENSSWKLDKHESINLKNDPDEKIKRNAPARSTPGGNSSWKQDVPPEKSSRQQPKKSSLNKTGGSQDFKLNIQVAVQPDPAVIKELRKNKTETPYVVSAAADAAPQEFVEEVQKIHLETQRPAPSAALLLHASPAPRAAEPPVIQVQIEQLEQWRADVAEQRQVVALAEAAHAQAYEQLNQCAPGGAGWGELRREQRYLAHQLETERRKLARFDLFVSLIEHGTTRDDACEQVYRHFADEASPAAAQAPERPAEAAEVAARPTPSREEPAPEPLQPKAWRAALFTGVLSLFGWEAQHLNQNSRGLANKAAMLLQESGIRPEQLPRLKQLFEQAYPRVRHYTPIALATHATEFVAAL